MIDHIDKIFNVLSLCIKDKVDRDKYLDTYAELRKNILPAIPEVEPSNIEYVTLNNFRVSFPENFNIPSWAIKKIDTPDMDTQEDGTIEWESLDMSIRDIANLGIIPMLLNNDKIYPFDINIKILDKKNEPVHEITASLRGLRCFRYSNLDKDDDDYAYIRCSFKLSKVTYHY